MPVRVNADQASQKWRDRLSASTTEIANGVARVNQAPGQKAAAKRAKWRQNVMAAEEKWARNVSRVSLGDWQSSMVNIGIPRVAQGAQAKQQKVTSFMNEFLPFLESGVRQVDALPDTTFEERVQKAVAMMRYNRGFKRSGGVTPSA